MGRRGRAVVAIALLAVVAVGAVLTAFVTVILHVPVAFGAPGLVSDDAVYMRALSLETYRCSGLRDRSPRSRRESRS